MKTEEIQDFIVELEKRIAGLEAEVMIRKYMSENGLDPDNASDYSKAAVKVLKYVTPEPFERRLRLSKNDTLKLLNGITNNFSDIDGEENGRYNYGKQEEKLVKLYDRLELLEKSEYGFGGDLVRGAKDWIEKKVRKGLRKRFGASRITNNSGESIAVVGNEEENGNITSMFLEDRGESDDYFYDTDGVIIMPNQKYYKPGTKEVVSEGAIKIGDTVKATVTKDGSILVFEVDFGLVELFDHVQYLDSIPAGWPMP